MSNIIRSIRRQSDGHISWVRSETTGTKPKNNMIWTAEHKYPMHIAIDLIRKGIKKWNLKKLRRKLRISWIKN